MVAWIPWKEVGQTAGSSLSSVFHPVDLRLDEAAAFAHALKLALAARARLSILHVQPGREEVDWADFPGVRSTLVRWGVLPKGAGKEDLVRTGLDVRKVAAIDTDPVHSILRYIERHPPDLVVLATHQRRGLDRWMSQPVAEPVARQSGVMTLFVPLHGRGFVSADDGRVSLARILVPAAVTPPPQRSIDGAATLTRALGCRDVSFLVLHVGAQEDMPRIRAPEGPGWTCETLTGAGNVVDEILRVATDRSVDLIAMTTAGHRGFLDALRGSTTERVLREASCPVLAVPMAY